MNLSIAVPAIEVFILGIGCFGYVLWHISHPDFWR